MTIERQPMPIIIGAPRSGTTLLRLMLDAHSNLAIPPETGFLPAATRFRRRASNENTFFHLVRTFPRDAPTWRDFSLDDEEFLRELRRIQPFDVAEGTRTFYRLYAHRHGKARYGDKTPFYSRHIGLIERMLPEAHFIHIIRDGRDVVRSIKKMWFAPTGDLGALALKWKRFVRGARSAGARCPAYMEVRYEELVCCPRPVVQKVCDFLALPLESSMLRYWERANERLKEHGTLYRSDGRVVVTQEQR